MMRSGEAAESMALLPDTCSGIDEGSSISALKLRKAEFVGVGAADIPNQKIKI